MVEYAISIPVFLLILLGMLEFGFAFSHHLTMEYATREGARTGAALGKGTTEFACNGVDDNNVDNQVIASVQRVLTGAGAQVNINRIGDIKIYKSNADGRPVGGTTTVWSLGAGPTVDGIRLKFNHGSVPWSACGRVVSAPPGSYPNSIGVSISYDYDFVTPLGALMGIGGDASLHMTDRTVMALNPPPQ